MPIMLTDKAPAQLRVYVVTTPNDLASNSEDQLRLFKDYSRSFP